MTEKCFLQWNASLQIMKKGWMLENHPFATVQEITDLSGNQTWMQDRERQTLYDTTKYKWQSWMGSGTEEKKNKCYKKHYWDKLTENRLEGLSQKSSDLRLHLAMKGTQVPSLVRELRSHMCHGVVKRFFFF